MKNKLIEYNLSYASSLIVVLAVFLLFSDNIYGSRKVIGKITYDLTGEAVEGALVKLWDRDSVNPDDFMNDDITNKDGKYEISYKNKHWDSAPHFWKAWRPDIYIEVFIKVDGKWLYVNGSKTFNNQKLKNDKTINLGIKEAVLSGKITSVNENISAEDVKVKAYDHDTFSPNDPLGNETFTNEQGYYSIKYGKRKWDNFPSSSKNKRPDIFIELSKSGYKIKNPESSIHDNHPVSEDLIINKNINIYPDKLIIKGEILYEESDYKGNSQGFKPVKFININITHADLDKPISGRTDSQGKFAIAIKRKPGKTYKLIVRPWNHAVKIFKDLDACNEEVWWRKKFEIPKDNDLDLGVMKIGIDKNTNIEGFSQEVDGFIVCGEEREPLNGGSAYFNIAETIRLTREWAKTVKNGDEAISQVFVSFPDDDHPHYNQYGEIVLPLKGSVTTNYGFNDGTIVHEYGHHLTYELSTWNLTWPPDHADCDAIDEEMAWSEGFPDYLSFLIYNKYRNDSDHFMCLGTRDMEDAEICPCNVKNKKKEAVITSVLWDLIDKVDTQFPESIDESSFDNIEGMEERIFKVFDNDLENLIDAPDICEFLDAFKNGLSRDLKNKVDLIIEHHNINCE